MGFKIITDLFVSQTLNMFGQLQTSQTLTSPKFVALRRGTFLCLQLGPVA